MSTTRTFHSDQVPDRTILDGGDYRFRLDSLDENPESDVWQMVAKVTVLEPKECEGQSHFERYTIGNADDPDGTDPKTLKKFGAVNFKKLLGACGQDTSGAIKPKQIDDVVGSIFDARVVVRTAKATLKDGSPNPYAGQENANISKYCKMGELEPQLLEAPKPKAAAAKAPAAKPAAAKPATAAKPAAAKPAPAPAETVEEEIEVEVE